jgi:hypothetical protein
MTFSHPLSPMAATARSSKFSSSRPPPNSTLKASDTRSAWLKNYRPPRDYVTRSDRVRAFLFMNPMKDWCRVAEASRGRPRDEMIHQMHILKKAHAEAGRQ